MKRAALLLIVFLFCRPGLGFSSDAEVPAENSFKGRAWVLEVAGLSHHLKGSKSNRVEGVGSRISIGYGKIQPLYFFFVSAELGLGPYNLDYRNTRVDYNASGLSLIGGSSVKNLTLRGELTSFGVLGGLAYHELVGQSIGRSDFGEILEKENTVIGYRNNAVVLETNFGIFFSWVKRQRLDRHEPELLLTRNDGVMLSLSFAVPVYSHFRSRIATFRADKERSDELERGNEDPGPTKVTTETGSLDGFKIILSLRAFLGT